MANGEWRMANGERRTANGEWRMANGEWRTANGERRMASFRGTGTPARAPFASRQRAAISYQRPVDDKGERQSFAPTP